MKITGAELFVKALLSENVDTLFAYPGGQAIDLFHALYGVEELKIVLPRHEQGLIHAADGYARSTGKVGVCLVTSGPGATNLVTGIATANYDSVPLVCFTGQVPTYLMGKETFQEVDIVGITRSICKYAVTVRRREDLAKEIKKAFVIAQSDRPGVAVVDLPKDIQQSMGSDVYPEYNKIAAQRLGAAIAMKQLEKTLVCLRESKRPLFLLGGGINISHANRAMTVLAEATGIPVVTTIMGKGALPTNHSLYIGNLGIHGSYAANRAVSECDVLFAIGVRFNDRITGNTNEFASKAKVIHVDINAACISRNIETDIPIVADASDVIEVLLDNIPEFDFAVWRLQVEEWKQQKPLGAEQHEADGVTPLAIFQEINQLFSDVVITTDVGQNQLWATQFLELTESKKLLTSGGFGTMGYGLPAALGAKLGSPHRDVIAICGDGGFQMTSQEMATAVVYELPVIACILNNGYLGNVRQWQQMFYGGHYSGTCLHYRKSCPLTCNAPSACCPQYTPDFIKLAESYGARAFRVQKQEEIKHALLTAKNTGKVPTVIEFLIEREENVLPIVPPGNAINDMIYEVR